jgi:hypothetical protein
MGVTIWSPFKTAYHAVLEIFGYVSCSFIDFFYVAFFFHLYLFLILHSSYCNFYAACMSYQFLRYCGKCTQFYMPVDQLPIFAVPYHASVIAA